MLTKHGIDFVRIQHKGLIANSFMLTIVSAKSKITFLEEVIYLQVIQSLYYSSASQIHADFGDNHIWSRAQVYLRYPYSANMNQPILSKFKQSSNS